MDHKNQQISSINLENNNIVIEYDNGEIETLPNSKETYIQMHNTWLLDQPPFISDIYKIQMRNIILATINNNQKCINDLNMFFSSNNDEVKKFLTYMRNRDLSQEKNKWSQV